MTPVAFVGVDGAAVRHNTIYRPRRWGLRILRENNGEGFVPCRNGQFTDNLIAFRSDEMAVPVNVGPGTAPETFTLARNAWYCLDAPSGAARGWRSPRPTGCTASIPGSGTPRGATCGPGRMAPPAGPVSGRRASCPGRASHESPNPRGCPARHSSASAAAPLVAGRPRLSS